MLESLKLFYNRVKQNIELENEYRIPIKTKNNKAIKKNTSDRGPVSSSTIAKLDKENKITTTDIENVYNLVTSLKNRESEREGKDDWV